MSYVGPTYIQDLVDLQQDLQPKNHFVSRRYHVSRCLTLCLGGLYKLHYLHAVTLHVVFKQSRGLVLAPLKILSSKCYLA